MYFVLTVANSRWPALLSTYAARFGFQGGRVLELACGIGQFIGLMPEDILRRSTVTSIEIDPLSAHSKGALHSDIRAVPIEQSKPADSFYDLIIFHVLLAITLFTIRVGTTASFPSTIISLPPRSSS